MNYHPDKYGNPISNLGYGCMRFPQKLGRIDLEETRQLVQAAFEAGVNYFDTAYIYPGSEAALGEVLEQLGIREQVYIATKLPHYLIRSTDGLEKCFREQLRRLRTDHIDYYLMHMLTDTQTWDKLKDMGILQWLEKKHESGAIRQVGFSYHGNAETFCQLVDAHDWDFCMIQYNYMDEHSQAGRRGLQHASRRGLPVIIMEPLRGGRLVNHLPEEALQIFRRHPAGYSPAQWALRWLWNQPEVSCVLSGMSSMEMLQDNIQTASSAAPGDFGDAEEEMLRSVASAINARMKVGCTGCGYCMPCPKNVDIPGTFSAYNRRYTEGWFSALKEYFMCTAMRRDSTAASNCIGCGKCERHCPQHIPIQQELKNTRKVLEPLPFRLARKIVRLIKAY